MTCDALRSARTDPNFVFGECNSMRHFMNGRRSLGKFFAGAATLLCLGCASPPVITELPSYVRFRFDRIDLSKIPVVLVGRIVGHSEIGPPRSSQWSSDFSVQLARVDVEVETVLQAYNSVGGVVREGKAPEGRVPVYYLHATKANPTPSVAWMGMSGYGGRWRMGDRVLFFLLRDHGHLRTACDQYNNCAIDVFSGAHPGYKSPSNDVTASIIDILLTRGQNASDQQMIKAIDDFHLYAMNAEYAMGALQKLAKEETPVVRSAARRKLGQELTDNCTQPTGYVTGPWEVPCLDYRKTRPGQE